MQVKATPTLCRAQIGCQWVGVFVLIFHMTLLIHRKVKGKGMMNFKCRQEDHWSKDLLVSFPGSEFPLSLLDTLLLAVTGPVCLYQHLATLFLPSDAHTHTHTSAVMSLFISIHIYSEQLATVSQLSLPPCTSLPLFPALPHFSIPLRICTCNQQIYLAEAWWEGRGWAEKS